MAVEELAEARALANQYKSEAEAKGQELEELREKTEAGRKIVTECERFEEKLREMFNIEPLQKKCVCMYVCMYMCMYVWRKIVTECERFEEKLRKMFDIEPLQKKCVCMYTCMYVYVYVCMEEDCDRMRAV